MATHPSLDTKKPLGLSLNREGAALLLKGLEELPEEDKTGIVFDRLKHDISTIIVIWDRRIKNERMIQDHRRKMHEKLKAQVDLKRKDRRGSRP
jgi:hypothetical protein